MAFVENNEEFYQWSNQNENDLYLQSMERVVFNTSNREWNNASGAYGEHKGYMNAVGGCPGICDPPQVMDANCNCVDSHRSQAPCPPYCGETETRPLAKTGGRGCCSRLQSAQCVGGMECVNCQCQPVVDSRGPIDKYEHEFGFSGWRNAGGDPSINVGGDVYNMQPTLAWNQGGFFGQPQGFGAGNLVCEPCPKRFKGTRQSCGGTGCYNRLGQRLAEAGTGIPPGMGVQYTQV